MVIVLLVIAIGAVALGLSVLPVDEPAGTEDFWWLPTEAVYLTRGLSGEMTSPDKVIEPVKLEEPRRMRFTRRGLDWKLVEVGTRNGAEYVHGEAYRTFGTAPSTDDRVGEEDILVWSPLHRELWDASADPPATVDRKLVARGKTCGRSLCDEYVAIQHIPRNDRRALSYKTIPRRDVNRIETTLLFEAGSDILRKRVDRWNGFTFHVFELLCYSPGPDRCA